jgi:hypothetical protein
MLLGGMPCMRNWKATAREEEGWNKVIGEAMAQKSAKASRENKKKNRNFEIFS